MNDEAVNEIFESGAIPGTSTLFKNGGLKQQSEGEQREGKPNTAH